ncbi:MAG: hypothetical protein GY833_10855 [Aestuariibacter sp.]|nr:hypothetical protein [Aestuariibacter sp.]|tara:strand:+ start:159774 stop:160280 length:507 start_codon:yes stop_codon:yes gene_type:complete
MLPPKRRNLNRDRVYATNPWLTRLLAELGLEVDLESSADQRALRRFIMGENTQMLDASKRRRVAQQLEFTIPPVSGNSLMSLTLDIEKEMNDVLYEKGIALDSVTDYEFYTGEDGLGVTVSYSREQTDEEFAQTQRFVYVSNELSKLRAVIYDRVNAAIAEHGSIPEE